ncbi:hypothetical protein FQN50_004124 [Emmonsiellopsis sp. PD_5]|nr:hypothetical protein FQN50_004124 [Emmonsiellopsis sp. PD_5]
MAEVFAIAASTISVIDVAVRASSVVIRLASKLSNASVEAQRVCELIGGLEETLKQIKDVISPPGTVASLQQGGDGIGVQLQNTLQACNADLDRLRGLLDSTEQNKSPRLSRFKGKLKFVSNEKEIRSVLEQISWHRTSLLLVLELVGRKNDRHMIDHLENIQQTSQSSAGEDIAAIRKQLDSLSPLVRDSATREALRENQIRALTNMLEGFETNISRCDHTVSTMILGSAVDASSSITAIFSFVEELYSACSALLSANPRAIAYLTWLQDQFTELLADTQQASAVELRDRKRRNREKALTAHRWVRYDQKIELDLSQDLPTSGNNRAYRYELSLRKPKYPINSEHVDVLLPFGRVRISFSKSLDRLGGVRLLFVPSTSRLKGFVASSIQGIRADTRMTRSICSFGIHHRHSKIFHAISVGDIAYVQKLLSMRVAHPNDRDEDGYSLLHVSPSKS